MTKKVKAKKRNPSDLTGRNNKARKNEIAALKKRIKALEIKINHVYKVCFCE